MAQSLPLYQHQKSPKVLTRKHHKKSKRFLLIVYTKLWTKSPTKPQQKSHSLIGKTAQLKVKSMCNASSNLAEISNKV